MTDEIRKKFENIEDPEVKQIMENVQSVLIPKLMELQEKLENGEIGMLKMLKIYNNLQKEAKKEYDEKFGRDFMEDMKIVSEHFNFSQGEIMNILNIG